jgi:hypothetical protein
MFVISAHSAPGPRSSLGSKQIHAKLGNHRDAFVAVKCSASPKRLRGFMLDIRPAEPDVPQQAVVEAHQRVALPASIAPSVCQRERFAEQLGQGGQSMAAGRGVMGLDRHGIHPWFALSGLIDDNR